MGCDIHSFVEIKHKKTGKWEKATGFKSDSYNANSDYFGTDEYLKGSSLLDGRNYSMFAILADVRNGYGFAGCDTGDAIRPISLPKGLPDDVSDEVKQESDEWGVDGHSHSWLTAEEIQNYKNNPPEKKQRGWVTTEVFKDWINGGKPYPCCGFVQGQNVIHASNDDCITVQEQNPDKWVYTQIEWTEHITECASFLFGDALKQLMNRSESGKGDDIRLVFWFDN